MDKDSSRNYIKKVAGGKYAKVDYTGTSKAMDAWYGLYAWIEENGYTFRDEPAFSSFHSLS